MTEKKAAERMASQASRAAGETQETVETLRTELPSSFIDLFEKSLARTRDMHDKLTSVMEHSTGAFGEAVSCANRGSAEYRAKLMEIARQNANSAFDLARAAFEVTSISELFELALAHQRKQFETAAAQVKELSALTQKVVSEASEPIRTGMTEPFRIAS